MKKTRKRVVVFSLLVAMGALLPADMPAQSQERPGGLFGSASDTPSNGMLNRGRGVVGSNLYGQGFGATNCDITGQTFGDNAPLGGGLFVLLAAGAGYATIKSRKQNKNRKK